MTDYKLSPATGEINAGGMDVGARYRISVAHTVSGDLQ